MYYAYYHIRFWSISKIDCFWRNDCEAEMISSCIDDEHLPWINSDLIRRPANLSQLFYILAIRYVLITGIAYTCN